MFYDPDDTVYFPANIFLPCHPDRHPNDLSLRRGSEVKRRDPGVASSAMRHQGVLPVCLQPCRPRLVCRGLQPSDFCDCRVIASYTQNLVIPTTMKRARPVTSVRNRGPRHARFSRAGVE